MPRKKAEAPSIPPEQILPSLFRSNMLRMILTKHIELNKLADQKANMLMTASSIVSAVLIANFDSADTMGVSIILGSSIATIIFAIIVIIPKPYHRENKCENLFYFRSFSQISEKQYIKQMKELMTDKEAIYDHYIKDIYRYGSITLNKRYKILRIALMIFLLGLTIGGFRIITEIYNV